MLGNVANGSLNSAEKSGFYIRSDYPEERAIAGGSTVTRERADNLFGASAGLDYTITDWLAAYTQYEFSLRESNFNAFEYTNNRVGAGVKVTF